MLYEVITPDGGHPRQVAHHQPPGQTEVHPRMPRRRFPGGAVLHRPHRRAVPGDRRKRHQGVPAEGEMTAWANV